MNVDKKEIIILMILALWQVFLIILIGLAMISYIGLPLALGVLAIVTIINATIAIRVMS